MADNSLLVQRDGGVLELQLNRPERRNAIDEDTARSLTTVLEDADLDPSVRSVLITGTGRDFCTGGDVGGPSDQAGELSPLEYRRASRHFYAMSRALWEIEKPVVSGVNGTVAGLGWTVALLADLVVAANEARWTHVFLRRGMVPHAGDTYFLPRILPFHQLMELALLSETVTSERIAEIGAVNRLVPSELVMPAARELARRLADGPTRSLGLTKRMYRNSLHRDMESVFEDERAATALVSTTADRVEGVRSLVEHRSPSFTGQ